MAYVSFAERFGMKKGLEEGLKQGLEQGRQEANQIKYEIALALFKNRQSADLISKVTGLTHEELLALQANNNLVKKSVI